MTIPVETSSTSPNFDDLLFYFQRCDAYADRLAFWEQYQLTDRLYYYNESDERAAVELLDKRWQCQSWEDIKQLPILTLTPFTHEEAQQFVVWALRVRPGIKPIISYEAKEKFVIERYSAIPSGSDKQFFLTTYNQQIEYQKNADFSLMGGNHLAEYSLKIDVSVYMEIITVLRIAADFPIAHRIWQAENIEKKRVMDWRLIDTYIYAQTILEMSRFLENFTSSSGTTNLAPDRLSNEQHELSHAQIAILHHIIKQPITKNNADQIARRYGQTSGQKLEQTYKDLTSELVRTGKGKYRINDYREIELLIPAEYKIQYDKELRAVIDNNIK